MLVRSRIDRLPGDVGSKCTVGRRGRYSDGKVLGLGIRGREGGVDMSVEK
jgi:hypothetical protein